MSLILSLRKKRVTSNASRNISHWDLKWYNRKSPSPLSYTKKSNAGRSTLTGRVVVWTKSSLLRTVKLVKVNYSFRSALPGFVSTLKLVPFSSKLLALMVFPSGEFSYFPASSSTSLFSFLSFRSSKKSSSKTSKVAHYSFVHMAPAFRKISNLEVRPGQGVQYARSAGCSAKIIKFDYSQHAALVKLPSGVRKFFSFYSILVLGPCALKLKRKMSCTKSGFWRSFGLKPKVRGVARNPVDHPHGGRTKSIKYPRTPWGKTTKFK